MWPSCPFLQIFWFSRRNHKRLEAADSVRDQAQGNTSQIPQRPTCACGTDGRPGKRSGKRRARRRTPAAPSPGPPGREARRARRRALVEAPWSSRPGREVRRRPAARAEPKSGASTAKLPGATRQGLEVRRRPAAEVAVEGTIGSDKERQASGPCPELLPSPPAVWVFCNRI